MANHVKVALKKYMNINTKVKIRHIDDYRNYKVSTKKIMDVLGYKPLNSIDSIVKELVDNLDKFNDFDNDSYYNIKVFKKIFPSR